MVSHLLRIWNGQASQRRRAMAQSDGYGRVLPERPAPHLGRVVRGTPSTLVSRSFGVGDSGHGTWGGLHAVLSSTGEDHLLFYSHPVGSGRYSHGQLHLPQLPGTLVRIFAA